MHRVVLYIIDFDKLGAEEVKRELENTRFANDCIRPQIARIDTRDIGPWSDEHPLNQSSTAPAAREALFADAAKSKT